MDATYELELIQRQAAQISGDCWTKRPPRPELPLSDQLGLVIWVEKARGPGGMGEWEWCAMLGLSRRARAIEEGKWSTN